MKSQRGLLYHGYIIILISSKPSDTTAMICKNMVRRRVILQTSMETKDGGNGQYVTLKEIKLEEF